MQRVLTALADPTRRSVLEVVRDRPRSVSSVAHDLPASQPAVSQHLKVLREAGLVTVHQERRRHLYRARVDRLDILRSWLDGFGKTAMQSYAEAVRQAKIREERA